jgi:hypothetical protein
MTLTTRHRGAGAPAAALAGLALLLSLGACSGAAPAASATAPAATVAAGDTSAAETPADTGAGDTAAAETNLGANGGLCALVPQAVVEGATGAKVVTVDAKANDCTWTLDSLSGISFRTESGDLSGARLAIPKGQQIPGIGDDSWWAGGANGLLGNLLYFTSKGQTYVVQLVLFPNDDTKNLQIAETIAKQALSKI